MIAELAATLPERQRMCVLTNEPAETELIGAPARVFIGLAGASLNRTQGARFGHRA